jgi:hypothetical protein
LSDLDEVLRRLTESLTSAVDADVARRVFELRVAVAMTNELMSALDRDDEVAAGLLNDMLDHQLSRMDGTCPVAEKSEVDEG